MPNQRWSLDLVADTFGASCKVRILAVIDFCCRETLSLVADTRISGARVAPDSSASSAPTAKCVEDNDLSWHHLNPGKLQQDSFIQIFNDSLCDDLVSEEVFDPLDAAQQEIGLRHYDHNAVRPNSSPSTGNPSERNGLRK